MRAMIAQMLQLSLQNTLLAAEPQQLRQLPRRDIA
jgi:hypothetical protein